MKDEVRTALAKMERISIEWWQDDPILFRVFSLLDKVSSTRQDTLGINISGNVPSISFNPNFVNTISKERLELVLVSECFKILLKHCTSRLIKPKQISSLSSSISVNQVLNSDLQMLLGGIDEITPSPLKFGLKQNECFEEYFKRLLEKQLETNQKIKEIWNSMTGEEKQQGIQDAVDRYNEEEERRDKSGYKDYEDEKDAMSHYFDPNGTNADDWTRNDIFDSTVDGMVNSLRGDTNKWGTHTGTKMAEIIAAREPKIGHRDIIRKFGVSVITGVTTSSRMKVNRRWDIERPGYRRTYKPKIIVAVDVSGSMSDDDLSYAFAILNMLLYYAQIIFVQFDTEIKSVEKNLIKAKTSFKVHGRGGTNFQQICDLSDEMECDGLIIYTDGGAAPPTQPKAKVLWLMHSKEIEPPTEWGMRVWLDRFSNESYF